MLRDVNWQPELDNILSTRNNGNLMMNNPIWSNYLADEEWKEYYEKYLENHSKLELSSWIYRAYETGDDVSKIFKNLKEHFHRLKKVAPDLYEYVMTTDFVNLLMYHLCGILPITPLAEVPKKIKDEMFAWLREQYPGEPTADDMWYPLHEMYGEVDDKRECVVLNTSKLLFVDDEKIINYMSQWSQCFKIKIEIDMSNVFQADLIYRIIKTVKGNPVNEFVSGLTKVLSFVSYFHNTDEGDSFKDLGEWIIFELEDKESLYAALKKNLINKQMAGQLVDVVFSRGKEWYSFMPLLIMKIHEDR